MQKETNLTVGQWCDRWFCENQARWSSSTVGGYRNLIYRHILPGIGGVPLTELVEPGAQCQKRLVRPSAPAALHGRSGPRPAYPLQPGTALPEATSRSI